MVCSHALGLLALGFLSCSLLGESAPGFCLWSPFLSYRVNEMAATCAEIGDSQGKPSYAFRLAPAGVVPEALSKRDWG